MKALLKPMVIAASLTLFPIGRLGAVPPGTETKPPATDSPADEEKGLVPSWKTVTGARTLVVTIPAPRGQIVDRDGRPLATNRVAYFPALKFPHLADPSPSRIEAYGRAALEKLNMLCFGAGESDRARYWEKDPQDFVDHYRHRRWLPYLLVGRHELSDGERERLESDLGSFGLIAHPAYMRHYPRGQSASHLIGYTGLKRPLPTGEIANGDPYFFEWEGKSGLEATFDAELTGKPGRLNIVFDAEGKEIERDMLEQPVAGTTIVTTLEANMQELAEEVLSPRSSMAVVDCDNGEILALASKPGYDLNDFVPSISQEKFSQLVEDPNKPLFGRAFQAGYPPASTFKVLVAFAALKEGTITPDSTFDCPNRLRVGAYYKHNWHEESEGQMALQKAIARSCNTWFYQVGWKVGSEALIREARTFGFGQLTKIPLDENPGLLPTNAWMIEAHGRRMYPGDVANLSIGQGDIEATPLQVAQAMAGIANGRDIWRVRLIKQKQNHANEVIDVSKRESIGRVEMPEAMMAPIRRGMVDVVHSSYGTGKKGYCSYAQIAAKTGTAEWKKNDRMTWFAGFAPANDPQFAFAIACEGGASGGRTVAPMAQEYFNSLYRQRDPEGDMFAAVRVPSGKEVASVSEEKSGSGEEEQTPSEGEALAGTAGQPEPLPPAPAPRPKPRKRSLLDRIFGR